MMIGALRCPTCSGPLNHSLVDDAVCQIFNSKFAYRNGILDLLPNPSPAVLTEMRGLAAENDVDFAELGPDGIKFLRVAAVESTAELMDRSRHERIHYYQQTASAYFEALARAQVDSHLRVVEVGAERTLWKLRAIEDLCDHAYGVNIFFHVPEAPTPTTENFRVLGDMNDLPFMDESLDLVIFSATLHHSSDIPQALSEASRILRHGGRAIVVNEPVAGIAKSLGGITGHTRDAAIHEDEVSFITWRKAIQSSRFRADHFVPAWFLNQLRDSAGLHQETRFRGVGRLLSPLARRSDIADLVRTLARIPGQAMLGVPLNAVLWKM